MFEPRRQRFREGRLKQRSRNDWLPGGIHDATTLERHPRDDLRRGAGKRVKKLGGFRVLLLKPKRSGDLRQQDVAVDSGRPIGRCAQSRFRASWVVVIEQLIDELLVRLGRGYEIVQIAT